MRDVLGIMPLNHFMSLWWHLFSFSFRKPARNLGNMGYHGKSSMYLPSNVLNSAFEMEGLLLSYKRCRSCLSA